MKNQGISGAGQVSGLQAQDGVTSRLQHLESFGALDVLDLNQDLNKSLRQTELRQGLLNAADASARKVIKDLLEK